MINNYYVVHYINYDGDSCNGDDNNVGDDGDINNDDVKKIIMTVMRIVNYFGSDSLVFIN